MVNDMLSMFTLLPVNETLQWKVAFFYAHVEKLQKMFDRLSNFRHLSQVCIWFIGTSEPYSNTVLSRKVRFVFSTSNRVSQ